MLKSAKKFVSHCFLIFTENHLLNPILGLFPFGTCVLGVALVLQLSHLISIGIMVVFWSRLITQKGATKKYHVFVNPQEPAICTTLSLG